MPAPTIFQRLDLHTQAAEVDRRNLSQPEISARTTMDELVHNSTGSLLRSSSGCNPSSCEVKRQEPAQPLLFSRCSRFSVSVPFIFQAPWLCYGCCCWPFTLCWPVQCALLLCRSWRHDACSRWMPSVSCCISQHQTNESRTNPTAPQSLATTG